MHLEASKNVKLKLLNASWWDLSVARTYKCCKRRLSQFLKRPFSCNLKNQMWLQLTQEAMWVRVKKVKEQFIGHCDRTITNPIHFSR